MAHALGVDESHPDSEEGIPPQAGQNPPPPLHWPEKGPRRTLDVFWSKNHDAIGNALTDTAGGCPLRMMKWRELERLVVSELQAQFIVFYGDAVFIRNHLHRFIQEFGPEKMTGELIPVARVGKIGHSLLYLIGIREYDSAMRVLSRFPFIMDRDSKGHSERLSTVLKTGVRATIIIASDPKACLEESRDAALDRECNVCSIPSDPSSEDRAIQGLFVSVADALSRMATEKPV
jgi:hypothetical protein